MLAIGQIGYLICAAGFLALGTLVLLSRRSSAYKAPISVASLLTALWALAAAAEDALAAGAVLRDALEFARSSAWLVFAGLLVVRLYGRHSGLRLWWLAAALAVILVPIAARWVEELSGFPLAESGLAGQLEYVAWLLVAVLGLLLLENLYRNASEDYRWGLKFLCFGLGTIFAYDFFYFADGVLFNRLDPKLFDARGFVDTLALPMIALSIARSQVWSVDIHVSRKVVFHTAALVGSGLYLLVMAGAGYYIRVFGGQWGETLQILFLVMAGLLLVIVFASGAVRANLWLLINKHFFSFKYDYREQWLNFIRSLSDAGDQLRLEERVLRAIAGVVDGTGGALWLHSPEDKAYAPATAWNFGPQPPSASENSPLITRLSRDRQIIELTTESSDRTGLGDAADAQRESDFDEWLKGHERAWLLVPLVHRDTPTGFIVIGTPRARRRLDWEDRELLATLGRQAASYLAEELASKALHDARQMEEFNRRFAFVAHDLKNIVNQLSLLLKNAEKFREDRQFQDDMIETVADSVGRMRQLLEQLKPQREQTSATTATTDLRRCILDLAKSWQGETTRLELDVPGDSVMVVGPQDRLRMIVEHVLHNAIEAAGADGEVTLRLRSGDGEATIAIEDDGPGMTPEFVREKLFRPFDTTKVTGYGMGAYQIREYVRQLGGRLEVQSDAGQGTTVRAILPLAEDGASRSAPTHTAASY